MGWSLAVFATTAVMLLVGSDIITASMTSWPYCVPEVWMGGRTTTTGVVDSRRKTTVTRTMGRFLYSVKLQKIRSDDNVFVNGNYVQSVSTIMDYPANILYTVIGIEPETCTKKALPGPFPTQCVPADASVSLVNTTYGAEQNVVTVMELSGIQRGYVNYRVTMTQGTHMPLYEQLWGGHNGENFFQTLSFYNVTVTSDIPDIMFKPPDECNQASGTWDVGKRSNNGGYSPVLIFP